MKGSFTLLIVIIITYFLAVIPIQLIGSSSDQKKIDEVSLPNTAVWFKTSDSTLQKVFDEAEKKAKGNIANFGKYKVLVEGGGYNFVWLETQPMGGVMYAKRNLEIAKNNIQIFMDLQREDGRFPGMITYDNKTPFPGEVCNNSTLNPVYGWFQGYYFPMPAFELYYWLNKDKEYLLQLYNALEKFDNYLWKTRDSDNDGCLESWCVYDTGEDNNVRYGNSPSSWPFENPPTVQRLMEMSEKELKVNCYSFVPFNKTMFESMENVPVPIESMDVMSYSYTGRDVLSLISKELSNGKEIYWRNKANDVREKIKDYLWDERRHACYDRDKSNKTMNILLHNNLRCMYYGSFDQEMADDFIKYHLLNPKEFWTPMPLPSIAVNDPFFRNNPNNSWSGQPEALTYQRSIRALENYGHYAELTMIGTKFLKAISDSLKFTQQFDPFTKRISTATQNNGYGPSILSSLEFISRLYGIDITQNKVYWSCLDNDNEYNYSQVWGDRLFKMTTRGNMVFCSINSKEVYSFTKGVRVVSDLDGKIIEVIGIETKEKKITISYKGKDISLSVKPNAVYNYRNKFYKTKNIEFSIPLQN